MILWLALKIYAWRFPFVSSKQNENCLKTGIWNPFQISNVHVSHSLCHHALDEFCIDGRWQGFLKHNSAERLFVDMDISYTRVLHIKVAYRVPHKWRHAFLCHTAAAMRARNVLCNSYNTRPLLCTRIPCYVTVITIEINHCSFRRVRFALLYIVTRSKIV
jgi:hypothetical protein